MSYSDRIKQVLESLNPEVDYVGQELANKLMHCIFIIGFPLAFLISLITKNIIYLVYALCLVLGASLLLVVPAWRMYRKNPVVFGEKKEK
ncbi:signal peptidase complex subunit 1 [Nematocida homosporus]|uniref:signal peptidase complex subunit 1 n=1 Tax=Nematocida homosporus TaxID=1912981 RepID=UPI00222089E0|nr:signal peptidase complex subunit 1 [Nematocida homosporus]KAI5185347.1 signal peptidase complex subunit 1 [Nematocida homosporus]